ncbi:SIMPL domain-containing protein [Niastella populi]|uniref:SIMPL domain-containing protein n=1 Tax=Niastella populi TaxID=550983 RepID=A0A1V9FLS1_9BACT|nr:SIMPL domain-containing protein [Niastella populi]OQP59290.1 hypothetical protein A4R26_20955 [Niastella populi]
MKKITTTLILAFVINGLFAQAPNPFPKTVSVSGSADLEIVPDEIYVQVTLKEYEKKGAGKTDLQKIKADFLASCRNTGLPDSVITIASYEGSLLKKRRSKEELYATISYQIKFNNSKKIDELVSKLDDEATQSFDVVRVSHSKIQEYRKQVRILAIKAAKEKAAYLTEAIGESLGTAVTITEYNAGFVQPGYFNVSQASMANTMENLSYNGNSGDLSGGGIDFRKLKIFMEVNAVFAIK